MFGTLDMVGQGTLPLEVKVAGAELAEEGLGLDVVLPHLAAPILVDKGCGIGHFGHVETGSRDKMNNAARISSWSLFSLLVFVYEKMRDHRLLTNKNGKILSIKGKQMIEITLGHV